MKLSFFTNNISIVWDVTSINLILPTLQLNKMIDALYQLKTWQVKVIEEMPSLALITPYHKCAYEPLMETRESKDTLYVHHSKAKRQYCWRECNIECQNDVTHTIL